MGGKIILGVTLDGKPLSEEGADELWRRDRQLHETAEIDPKEFAKKKEILELLSGAKKQGVTRHIITHESSFKSKKLGEVVHIMAYNKKVNEWVEILKRNWPKAKRGVKEKSKMDGLAFILAAVGGKMEKKVLTKIVQEAWGLKPNALGIFFSRWRQQGLIIYPKGKKCCDVVLGDAFRTIGEELVQSVLAPRDAAVLGGAVSPADKEKGLAPAALVADAHYKLLRDLCKELGKICEIFSDFFDSKVPKA